MLSMKFIDLKKKMNEYFKKNDHSTDKNYI